ncbi:YhjD/YihY/BrkB family envelope integrity protein [Gordonia liuliyuniae]|uniref:YihY family inner membrane protein n=1 Tax=Gordonia liuliyuniae TaxID=2911517 RepID=A0ABS9IXP6_9ACTN|nr:YhjD/YihY/BrkB family envelope integrity protein [Gordonia liuliyuniae]MCF8590348.1 YihY family inner membrane protein [Gordonia liuliyuniae]
MDRIKALIARLKAFFATVMEWPPVARLMAMQDHYNQRRGNTYAAAISFIGILSLVPVLMVAFSVAAFVLASRPELIQDITDAVVENVPGELGTQLNDIIGSAIESRRAVGVIGLLSAALTGLGWMALVRMGLSEMWGGRQQRSAVMGKVYDLINFVLLGVLFVGTIAITVFASGPVGKWVLGLVGVEETWWGKWILKIAAVIISVVATWLLFSFVLAKLPLQKLPIRVVMPGAFVTAIVFEILKSLGSVYLQSVMSSPAGAAFGPIIGVMVFAYLASRIVLYASAWNATNPDNEKYLTVDEVENPDDDEKGPVYLAPIQKVSSGPKAREILTAAGLGAAAGAVASAVTSKRREK